VMATNGGAIAANAFSLASTPIAGGFKYTLDQSGGAWFLVSSPTATVAGLTSSINSVAKAQQSQMITNRALGSLLLGAPQQISCSSCGGGFASIGSFALGGSGRWRLSDNLTLLGGLSYNQWSASGIPCTTRRPSRARSFTISTTGGGAARSSKSARASPPTSRSTIAASIRTV